MTRYILFITEKPSVAQTYKDVLQLQSIEKNNGYIKGYSPVLSKEVVITWAVGHLIGIGSPDEQKLRRSLPSNHKETRWRKEELPLLPETFFFRPNHATITQFNVIKSLYLSNDIDTLYYAGDAGREGIYIQALIRNQIFEGQTPSFNEKVIWIDSQTEEEILRGIREAKPYSAYQNMIDSGYKRAISDWLIGMNLTRALTLSCGGLITIGRVQTPTLAMVVARQAEIDNFKVEDYYGINANIDGFNGAVKWKAVKTSRYFENPLLFNDNGFKQKSDAEKLLSDFNNDKKLTVADVKITEKREMAPYLFNMADLQAYCAKTLYISPDETLAIAQTLYEKKLITYPRTDARVLSSAIARELSEKIGRNIPDRYIDDNKISDHYAIIPTFMKGAESLSGNEQIVYTAIYNRFKAILMPPYVYDSISIVWEHSNKERFFSSAKKVKSLGWKKIYNKSDTAEQENVSIPLQGKTYSAEFCLNAMQTTPPSPYTTGTLILAMENAGKLIEDENLRAQLMTDERQGIGTSATRDSIIKNLVLRGYINVDKKQKVTPTEKGKEIIPIVKKVDAVLTSPEKTADMEQKLHDIAEGRLSASDYQEYIEHYIRQTTDIAVNLKDCHIATAYGSSMTPTVNANCPFCNTPIKAGPYGWYCPNKDFSFGTVAGHKMKEQDLFDLLTKGKTKAYSFTSKAGKKFKAHLVLNTSEKKTEFEFC